MSKRFTDSRKWDDPWFLELSDKHKLAWVYILDKCNHAGIYKHSNKMMNFFLDGCNLSEFLSISGKRLVKIKGDKYFIPKFILFQYGILNPENRAHNSVITILKDEGLYKGLISPMKGYKDKDKDKVKVNKGGVGGFPFADIWDKYPNKDGKKIAEKHFKATVLNEDDWKNINKALNNYINCRKAKEGFIKNGSTWFNNWQDWIDFKEPNSSKDPELDEARRKLGFLKE